MRFSPRSAYATPRVNATARSAGAIVGALVSAVTICGIAEVSTTRSPWTPRTKSALDGMSRVLTRELGPDGNSVNTIIVGAIRTGAEAAYGGPVEVDRTLLELRAIKRRGEPDDAAGVVAFLASRDTGFIITGQAITVDGGRAMR